MRARLEFSVILPLVLAGFVQLCKRTRRPVYSRLWSSLRLSSSCEIYNILSLSTIALTWLRRLAFRSKSLWKASRGHCETKNQLLEYYNVAFDAKVRGFIAKQKVPALF
jgi:hypothetical protein